MTKEYTVVAPDGKEITLIGPEGASQEEVIAQAQRLYTPQSVEKPTINESKSQQPLTAYQSFLKGLSEPIIPQGRTPIAGAALAGLGGETLKNIGALTQLVSPTIGTPMVETGQALVKGANTVSPTATTIGQIGSYAIPTSVAQGGLNLLRKGASYLPELGATKLLTKPTSLLGNTLEQGIIGGAVNAATTPDNDRLGAGVVGLGLGAISPTLGLGISKVLSPEVRSDVAKLIREGVTLTPGQIMGGALKKLEEKISSVPIVGEAIGKTKELGVEAFNKAIYKRALDPIGGTIPENTGRVGIQSVKNQLSGAYDDLLPKLNLTPDNVLSQNLATLDKSVRGLPVKDAKNVEAEVSKLIQEHLPENGILGGREFKVIESELSRLKSIYSGSQSANEKLIGEAYDKSLQALRENLARSNPQYAKELNDINRGFANYAIIRSAGSKAGTSERFTPNQLSAAIRQADKTAGKGGYASGERPLQDLADMGERVLPSTIADSGTAGRQMAVNLKDWLLGTALAAPYMPGGRQATQAILTQRPEMARALADYLRQNPSAMTGSLIGVKEQFNQENK